VIVGMSVATTLLAPPLLRSLRPSPGADGGRAAAPG